MSGRDVQIAGADGEFGAYLAAPGAGRGPGIVVIQEIFGVNAGVRAIADDYAARGYFALAPDLFWRLEPGVQLTDRTDADMRHAFDLMGRFDPDKGTADIQASLAALRAVAGATGKAGAVGYCLGGLLAYLAATRTDSDATVGYYGVNIQDRLVEAGAIKKPLMLHIAGEDEFVDHTAQAKVVGALKSNPRITIHLYPEMHHAFGRVGGAHYDKACADLANTRSATFFRQHLS